MAELSLEIVEGPDAGRQFPLREPLVIGRAKDVNVVLADRQVSRRHAQVSPHGAQALVEDLGSSNGTFVNGNQLHAPTPLGPGDDLLVGVSVLEVRSLEQIAARPSAVRPVPEAIATEFPAPVLAVPPPAMTQGDQSPPPGPPVFSAAPLLQPGAPDGPGRQLEDLLDVRVKRRAQLAPLAIFVLLVLAVLIYFAALR